MHRSRTLDIAKGIVIILMVIGHCYSIQNNVLTLIYGFHMPFFFIASGIIYGEKMKDDEYQFKPIIAMKRLLLPYFIFDGLFAVFLVVLNHPWGLGPTFIIKAMKVVSLRGATVTWYLPCLLIVEVCFMKLYEYKRVSYVISALLFLIALTVPVDGYAEVLWRCFIGVGFFAIGFYIGGKTLKKCVKNNSLLLIMLVFSLCIYVVSALTNGLVSLVSLKFSNPFRICLTVY